MIGSLGEAISLISATLVAPFAVATEPIPLPLPQPVNYVQQMRMDIQNSDFSTDPSNQKERVLAFRNDRLMVRIVVNDSCPSYQADITYRVIIENFNDEPTPDITASFYYPPEKLFLFGSNANSGNVGSGNGRVFGYIGSIPPQGSHETIHVLRHSYSRQEYDDDTSPIPTYVRIRGLPGDFVDAGLIVARHQLEKCEEPTPTPRPYTPPPPEPNEPEVTEAPLPDKYPAIICDHGEIDCEDSIPELGFNFNQSVTNSSLQPTICSSDDPDACIFNLPNLGPRFAEAIADIVPGECKVLADDIVSTPEFHDAFIREGDDSAPFMEPLYNSTQDFKRLVHENEILGMVHNQETRQTLQAIHTKHWQRQAADIRKVLNESMRSSTVRNRVNQYHEDWIEETEEAQEGILEAYESLQETRLAKYEPVAEQAVNNADEALSDACGQSDTSGLRSALLGDNQSVKQTYTNNLTTRLSDYATTQSRFVAPNIAAQYLPQTWQSNLREALNAFDQDNPDPLQDYLDTIPEHDRVGFSATWSHSYIVHAEVDARVDNEVRLNHWQVALQDPKSKATECTADRVFPPSVETTWCEAGDYPEHVIQGAPMLTKKSRDAITPPKLIEGGGEARIDPERVVGQSCGGRPGDPFWSYDCSCNCNDIVINQEDSNISLCKTGEDENELPIIRHDAPPLTSREECLQERARHTEPDPGDASIIRF